MGILSSIWRKKSVDPNERRRHLMATGRITDGVIVECETTPDGGEIALYTYTLNGVEFESSEILTDEQRSDPASYAPGAKVGIRYDPRNQGNSIIE